MAQSLTLNEIRARALAFSREWKGEESEAAEKQTFWNEFFEVFGLHRRRLAKFEVPVALKDAKKGKIDLFWPGTLLVEHKSGRGDLTAAFEQAADYFEGIEDEDLPEYVIVSDFANFRVYNLDEKTKVEFALSKLHQHVGSFGFLSGHTFKPQEEAPQVNVKAARLMAELHDDLRKNGYAGHPLAVLLVRLMFCMFADHTGLWARGMFRQIIDTKTEQDGGDVGGTLLNIFAVLDTPEENRQKNLDEDLATLPFVNGRLFVERFDPPAFDASARKTLLKCCSFDWSAVSPAIFGAMFQGVMEEQEGKRRGIGAHYTSEKNILKALRPLLLDQLRAEMAKATTERSLNSLLNRIAKIAILDPACGCGNFLIVAYRELRQLEIEIHRKLKRIRKGGFLALDFTKGINVDAMFGIEIEEFPVRVAETALYLIDHIMNMKASEEFGENFVRLPLNKAPNIAHANALRIDWQSLVPAGRLTCIVGNPPFVGKALRTDEQSEDMNIVFGDLNGHGELDYVAAWYVKALNFIRGTSVPVAFVSTNSITQGEQVSILWPRMLRDGVRIHFAHRTFRWDNDAPGEASVYCVIIGWGLTEPSLCQLFDYQTPKSSPLLLKVRRISPYLIDFDDVFVFPRRKPLCSVPPIAFGNMPNDGGHLLMTTEERGQLLKAEPRAKRFIRRIYGSQEFINSIDRWCLWLVDATPGELRSMPRVMDRVIEVRKHREKSKRRQTKELAKTPALFGEIRQPSGPYLAIPKTSSESRTFIPIGYLPAEIITTTEIQMVVGATTYHFGVLQSTMHMAWMRQVCGRLKSDFRYSNEIVYNNFPWPALPTEAQQLAVSRAAQSLLDVRAAMPGQSLADLYDADVMPTGLIAAHKALDRAVDRCYRRQPFENELARVRFLFERYAELIADGQMTLVTADDKKRGRKKTAAGKRT